VRKLYEVRVRVKVGEVYVKKSKFYNLRKPEDAKSVYKGPGSIMTVEKVGKERLLGVGTFFKLGNDLLREFNLEKAFTEGGDALDNALSRNKEKEKAIKRRDNARQRKKTSHRYERSS